MDSDKTENPPESSSSWPYWLLGALILYPLSIGPMILLFDAIHAPDKILDTIYAPLKYLYDHFDWAKSFFNFYLHLWGVK